MLLSLPGYFASDPIEGLTVIPGSLPGRRFATETALTLEHQGLIAVQLQTIGEVLALGFNLQRTQSLIGLPLQLPVINPGGEGLQTNTGMSNPAARKTIGMPMPASMGECRVTEPDLRAVPTRLGLLRRLRLQGLTEQGPLHTPVLALLVDQIGGDIPPFNTVIGMGCVVLGEAQFAA